MTARDRILLSVVASFAVLAAFWFMALSPKRQDARDLDAKIATAQGRLDTAQASASTAEAAKARYARDYATVARLGKAVPVDDDVPSLLYQLETSSHSSHVDFRKIELNGNAASSAAATSGTAASASTSTSTLPPGATVGAAGFPTMPFQFAFDGSFFHMEDFLRNVQGLTTVRADDSIEAHGRLLSVDGISLQAGPRGFPQVKASLTATAYLLPADEGLTAGGTSTTPAAGTTAAASTPTSSASAESYGSDR